MTEPAVTTHPRLSVVPEVRDGQHALRVRVLDIVSIAAEDGPTVAIGSSQQKTFLTMLVAAKGRSVALDAIADELWPDERPRRWRGCLATLANSLRKTVGDSSFILSTSRGYTLHARPETVRTDVEDLHELLEQARQAEEQGRMDAAENFARTALATYGTGPWSSDYWGWTEAGAEAARILATALVHRSAYLACIGELTPLIDDFDWHDTLWACLVYAHHQLGNTRRAAELAQRAKLAVGASTPLLDEVDRHLAFPRSFTAPFPFAASA